MTPEIPFGNEKGRAMSSLPFCRFEELTPEKANVELQMHTSWTDGRATIEEMLKAARLAGVSTVAFTEHVRRDTDWFPQFVTSVRREAERFPDLTVLVGCEAKALDANGTLDATDEVLELSDIVLGSVHRFPDGSGGLLNFSEVAAESFAEMECELALGLIRNAPIDVLAHPGGMFQRKHGRYPDSHFRQLMEASRATNAAIEINVSYLIDFDSFLNLCEETGCRVSIGSDAHSPAEVGRCRDALLSKLFPESATLT